MATYIIGVVPIDKLHETRKDLQGIAKRRHIKYCLYKDKRYFYNVLDLKMEEVNEPNVVIQDMVTVIPAVERKAYYQHVNAMKKKLKDDMLAFTSTLTDAAKAYIARMRVDGAQLERYEDKEYVVKMVDAGLPLEGDVLAILEMEATLNGMTVEETLALIKVKAEEFRKVKAVMNFAVDQVRRVGMALVNGNTYSYDISPFMSDVRKLLIDEDGNYTAAKYSDLEAVLKEYI